MSLIHQLQTNVLYLRLTGMLSGFVRAGTERPVPPLPVSRPTRAHYSFVKCKRAAAPAVNNRVPPAAATKANGKVGFAFAPRRVRGRLGPVLPPGGGGPPGAACPTASWEAERVTLRRYYGKKPDSNGSAERWGLPGRAPRRKERGRERRAGPAPARRVAEGWGPFGSAVPALPAAPCPPLRELGAVRPGSLPCARRLSAPPPPSLSPSPPPCGPLPFPRSLPCQR